MIILKWMQDRRYKMRDIRYKLQDRDANFLRYPVSAKLIREL